MQILVIDDHALIREALRTVLKELDEGVTIHEAASWREAMVHLERAPGPDLVLLDLGLPDSDGFDRSIVCRFAS